MFNIEGKINDLEATKQSIEFGINKLSNEENLANINEGRCLDIIAKTPTENLQQVCSQLNNDFANVNFFDNKANFLATFEATVKNPVGTV